MSTWRTKGLVTVLAGSLLSCGDGTGPSTDDLAGTWLATKAEIVSVANPAVKVDLVALGGTVRLVLTAAHAFTLTVSMPGEPQEVTTGTWSSSVDVLTLNDGAADIWQFEMTLDGDTLRLTGADIEFNVDGVGGDDPAKLNLVLSRE
jgi:hypothetical protein